MKQFFKKLFYSNNINNNSANIARERLKIIVSSNINDKNYLDFLPKLKHEIISLINKYGLLQDNKINIVINKKSKKLEEINIFLKK